jgi:iron-sulfur cluster assembly protein
MATVAEVRTVNPRGTHTMLTVTDAAAEAINALSTAEGKGESGGLRFAVHAESEEGATLAVSVAAEPTDGDEVVTGTEGAQVFLDPQAALYLSDKVLDVQPDEQGQLNFAVVDQA